jgi:hypothetical protein
MQRGETFTPVSPRYRWEGRGMRQGFLMERGGEQEQGLSAN